MSYLVLARKYRPQTFDEVVGQGHVTRTLKNAIKSGRISHAYLFSGPRGIGKTTVARLMAKALNCTEGPTPDFCNKCPMCTGISEGKLTDVYEIDGASNTGVDDVRELRENVRYLPSVGRYKIYIIDEVHMLSINAFNALLKVLEEPPAHVIFIFATTEPQKIPVTILSRTQRFDFRRISSFEISKKLGEISKAEGISVTDGALTIISREAEGSMRDAQSLFDQVIGYAKDKVAEETVREVLGLSDRRLLFEMAGAVIGRNASLSLSLLEDVYRQGYDIVQYYREFVELVRNILVAKVAGEKEILDLTKEELDDIVRLGERMSTEELTMIFNILFGAEQVVKTSGDPKIAMELLLIKMARIGSVESIDEIIQRLLDLDGGGIQGKAGAEALSFDFSLKEDDQAPPLKKKFEGRPPELRETEGGTPRGKIEEDLDGFFAKLQRSDPKIHSILSKNRSIIMSEEKFRVEFQNGDINIDLISNNEENLAKLKKELKEFYKRDIEVEVKGVEVKRPNTPKDAGKGDGFGETDKEKELLKTEAAKNIIDVLDADVRGYTHGKK